MPFTSSRFRKIILGIAVMLVSIIVVWVIIISPLAKYLIEKYDVEYTGRQIKVDGAYVNPFTGYVHIKNLWISESYKDTIFFSAENVTANIEMRKLFSRVVEIAELDVDRPLGIVIQKKDSLNLNDIIQRFSPKKNGEQKSGGFHVSIDKLNVHDGTFHYLERIIPIKYFIEKVNMQCSGISWNADTIASTLSFESRGGKTNGNFVINTKTLDYHFKANVKDQDLEIIRQYLWELINYGMFRAKLNANVTAHGNFKDPRRITLKGRLAFNDFHLGKTTEYDYASFKKLVLVMEELSPANNKYLFDSVSIDKSFFNFEHFDSLDNIQAMFGKKGSNITDVTKQRGRFNLVIEISRYIKKLARDFFVSQYEVKRLSLNDGEVWFSDYDLEEKFTIGAQHVYLTADSISKNQKRVRFYLKCGIHPYGNSVALLNLNPRDSGDLDLIYNFRAVPVTVFNPYLVTYTAFPLNKGTLGVNGVWHVRKGKIKSHNFLVVDKPHVAERVRSKDVHAKIPLPLIMAFVRERGDVINYKIPITGNLKNPHFHLHDVLFDIFKNTFIKPPTIPYALEVKHVEKEIEESLELTWPVHQATLEAKQEKFMEQLARYLEKNKDASIDVRVIEYAHKEKEHILFYETKKKYFLQKHHIHAEDFSRKDSVEVEKMSVKSLSHWLTRDMRKMTRDTTMFTIHDRCLHFLDKKTVERKYTQLTKLRKQTFLSYFTDKEIASRVKIHPANDNIPYNGFSCFQIRYKGEIPNALRRAYRQMNDLNSGIFRKQLADK
jgi:hypothetical protein